MDLQGMSWNCFLPMPKRAKRPLLTTITNCLKSGDAPCNTWPIRLTGSPHQFRRPSQRQPLTLIGIDPALLIETDPPNLADRVGLLCSQGSARRLGDDGSVSPRSRALEDEQPGFSGRRYRPSVVRRRSGHAGVLGRPAESAGLEVDVPRVQGATSHWMVPWCRGAVHWLYWHLPSRRTGRRPCRRS
jgi:hypothetical protein